MHYTVNDDFRVWINKHLALSNANDIGMLKFCIDVTGLFTRKMWKIVPFQIADRIKIAFKCICTVTKVKIVFTPFQGICGSHRARSLKSILFWGKFVRWFGWCLAAFAYIQTLFLSFFLQYGLLMLMLMWCVCVFFSARFFIIFFLCRLL